MTFSTPDLCDDFPEAVSVLDVQFRNFGGRSAFAGEVATVLCHEDNSRVREAASEAGNGRVLVVDGGGSLKRALLGDVIAKNALNNGWAGFIINGAIRDVDLVAGFDLGVFALGSIPLKTDRKGLGEFNVPVEIGNVAITPGMFVYADNNGVLVSKDALL